MALRAGRLGVNPADVNPIDGHIKGINYSTSDNIIGKWVDGRDIYRKVISTNTPTTSGVSTTVYTFTNPIEVLNINGMVHISNTLSIPLNLNIDGSTYIGTFYDAKNIKIKVGTSGYANRLAIIIVDYVIPEANAISE